MRRRNVTVETVNKRIKTLYILGFLFIIAIAIRLGYLQIYQYEELKSKAEKIHNRVPINLSKKRGLITDRNENVLAIDIKTVSLYAFPREYNLKRFKISEMAKKISPIIGESIKDVEKDLKSESFIWLKRKMPMEKLTAIKKLRIPGIVYVFESKREYPKKQLAAPLLGFTGLENQALGGIELSFDDILTKNQEPEKIYLDGIGREILRRQENILPFTTSRAKMNKVVLTLDETIQYFAERSIENGVKKYKAKRGVVIVMDLQEGDLFALATYPTFDPNNYFKSNWEVKKNWAVTDMYEPGSTMKIFSISSALELNKTSLEEVIDCPGSIKVETWTVMDHGASSNQLRKFKPIDIIKYSSNVGTSIVSRRMTPAEHRNMLVKFGFGKPTDSKLFGEVGGWLPVLPWRPSKQSAISFGQSIAVTPLQIVTAMSAIARGGLRIEPKIIKEIADDSDYIIRRYQSKEQRVISKESADKMLSLMVDVVEARGGTGEGTKIKGYKIAGKTGTADKVENGKYSGNVMASFIGFFPAEKPKVLLMVLLDSPQKEHFASLTAVPIFKDIVNDIIRYTNLYPSNIEELAED